MCHPRSVNDPSHAGDVDDGALFALEHALQHVVHQVERREQIDRHQLRDALGAYPRCGLDVLDPGVVHEHVDGTERLDRVLDEQPALRKIIQIRGANEDFGVDL